MNKVVRSKIRAGSPPTKEPGPDLSVPSPKMPDARSGSSLSKMNYGPRWAATNCQNKKCKVGEAIADPRRLRLHRGPQHVSRFRLLIWINRQCRWAGYIRPSHRRHYEAYC